MAARPAAVADSFRLVEDEAGVAPPRDRPRTRLPEGPTRATPPGRTGRTPRPRTPSCCGRWSPRGRRTGSSRSSLMSSHGVHPDGSRGGLTRPIDPVVPPPFVGARDRARTRTTPPTYSPFPSAPAPHKKKGKRTDQGAQRSPRNLLRPGDPAPGCYRTTTAPHGVPDGRPHRPQPITLCREGGGSKVSVLYAEKQKPIKNRALTGRGRHLGRQEGSRRVRPARPPSAPPQRHRPLRADSSSTPMAIARSLHQGGHSTFPMTLATPAPAPATATASSSLQRTRGEEK